MHINFSYFELCEVIADNTVHNTRMKEEKKKTLRHKAIL